MKYIVVYAVVALCSVVAHELNDINTDPSLPSAVMRYGRRNPPEKMVAAEAGAPMTSPAHLYATEQHQNQAGNSSMPFTSEVDRNGLFPMRRALEILEPLPGDKFKTMLAKRVLKSKFSAIVLGKRRGPVVSYCCSRSTCCSKGTIAPPPKGPKAGPADMGIYEGRNW